MVGVDMAQAFLAAPPRRRGPRAGMDAGEDADMEEDQDFATEGSRWARDSQDVVWCQSAAGLVQAVADGNLKVEVGAISDGELGALMEAVAQVAPHITALSLTGCQLNDAAVGRLGDVLAASRVEHIGVSNNPDVGTAAWAHLWAKLPATVVKWDFGDCGLPDEALPSLVASLGKGRVQELFLDGNDLADISPLFGVLRESPLLGELDLGDNNLTDPLVCQLAGLLPGSGLTALVLGRNSLTDISGVALAAALPQSKLEILHLDSTQVSDSTLQALCQVLSSTVLEELHLDGTQVKDAGVLQLVRALPGSKVKMLDVSDNGLSESTISAIEAALPEEDMVDKEEDMMD
mmetsp:Transcript_21799/g.65036  ORF Transcript_21799/g.65036 Transcript_21799/m.65036 type:complete len:348 (-) Transcript_21799:54-1097(-)